MRRAAHVPGSTRLRWIAAYAVLVVGVLVLRGQWRHQANIVGKSPPSAPQARTNVPGRIVYFGITHESSVESAVALEYTMGTVLPAGEAITWYSTAPEQRLARVRVLVPSQGHAYEAVYHRVLMIIRDVWQQHAQTNAQWFMRMWDDTFVFPERLAQVAAEYDANTALVVGNFHNVSGMVWMQGGAGLLFSRRAFQLLAENLSRCPKAVDVQEDVTLTRCLVRLNVALVHRPGFHQLLSQACYQDRARWQQAVVPYLYVVLNLTLSDLSCRRRFLFLGSQGGSPALPAPLDRGEVPVTLHYVHPLCAFQVFRAWYNTTCAVAMARGEQLMGRAKWGRKWDA